MSRCLRCGKKPYACFCTKVQVNNDMDWWTDRDGVSYKMSQGSNGYLVKTRMATAPAPLRLTGSAPIPVPWHSARLGVLSATGSEANLQPLE